VRACVRVSGWERMYILTTVSRHC